METFQTPFGDFTCYKNDQNFYHHLKNDRFWEIDLILCKLRPYWETASCILDIGAHIGSHSFLYSFYNSKAQIYAFEPQSNIYKVLCKNMESRKNVNCINTCVGHALCKTRLANHTHFGANVEDTIQYGDAPTMNLGGVSIGTEGEEVSMITVDSLNLSSCDFLKIDVEGAEGLVLLGAKETLLKYKPVICFEYIDSIDTSAIAAAFQMESIPTPHEILQELGYEEFIRIEGDNWLALPKVEELNTSK